MGCEFSPQNWVLNFSTASALEPETSSETSSLPFWDGPEVILEEYTNEKPTIAIMARTTKMTIFFLPNCFDLFPLFSANYS